MYLEVLSPGKTVFSGNIKLIKVPGTGGSFEVMNNHAPLISTLDEGKVKVEVDDSTTRLFNITGGVIQVVANKIILLAESISDSD
jgi:F-type H+-transporting ATPase subunit epsilon